MPAASPPTTTLLVGVHTYGVVPVSTVRPSRSRMGRLSGDVDLEVAEAAVAGLHRRRPTNARRVYRRHSGSVEPPHRLAKSVPEWNRTHAAQTISPPTSAMWMRRSSGVCMSSSRSSDISQLRSSPHTFSLSVTMPAKSASRSSRRMWRNVTPSATVAPAHRSTTVSTSPTMSDSSSCATSPAFSRRSLGSRGLS